MNNEPTWDKANNKPTPKLSEFLLYFIVDTGDISMKTFTKFLASCGFNEAYTNEAVEDMECPTNIKSVLFVCELI